MLEIKEGCAVLVATDIYKSYKSQQVLRGVSLEIGAGEFVSIMGESGSGKSTLLSILAGNLPADSGSVMLDGEDICKMSERALARLRRTKLGFVYQSLNLVQTLNVTDNILLPLYLGGENIRRGKERMAELAKRLEISHLLSKMPQDMSGGERQRVAIARAMIHTPRILMLDEPTGSLDSRTTGEVLQLLVELKRETGVTVVQVTHSEEAALMTDRIIKIRDGRIAE